MHLFSDIKFHDYKRQRVEEMEDEIDELSSDELENSTDALALIFAEKYGHSQLRVHDPIKEDGGEVEKDVSDDPRRMIIDRSTPTYKTAQRITVKLPYEGPKQMLKVLPKSHTMSLPEADRVTNSYIIFNVDFFSDETDADEVRDKIEKRISEIKSYVSKANGSIRSLNDHLETKARAAINRRREQVEAANDTMNELGVDRDTETPTGYVKPEKKRDIDITTATNARTSHDVLPDTTFRNILEIIGEFGISLERSAPTVRSLDEESLRDLFLNAINTHYGGLATGETFNHNGKTDIHLRHNNENLFIAECKFWNGQQGHRDTIDQLLGNLTVRDTHAAAIIFSRRQNFAAVQDKIQQATTDHDNYGTTLTTFTDYDVYRFEQNSGTPVKVAVKAFDLAT
ncbi:V-type ATP synthase subunit I domain-containing protein [Haloferax volcanii]|uniref:hypothetical protein n=1 Tax=Haloferax volcanii TaxID=2246 RepID=UPI0038537566